MCIGDSYNDWFSDVVAHLQVRFDQCLYSNNFRSTPAFNQWQCT